MNGLTQLDEALSYLNNNTKVVNEGLIQKVKKLFVKKKSHQKEIIKVYCTEEEYDKIEQKLIKIYKQYYDAANKAVKKYNMEKYVSIYNFNDTDSDSIINYGQIYLYSFDIFEYANLNNLKAREIETSNALEKEIDKLYDEIKSNIKSVSGIRIIKIDEGGDWDDFVGILEFSRDFIKSLIKES